MFVGLERGQTNRNICEVPVDKPNLGEWDSQLHHYLLCPIVCQESRKTWNEETMEVQAMQSHLHGDQCTVLANHPRGLVLWNVSLINVLKTFAWYWEWKKNYNSPRRPGSQEFYTVLRAKSQKWIQRNTIFNTCQILCIDILTNYTFFFIIA